MKSTLPPSQFLIVGFLALNGYKLPFFSVILFLYCMTICENLLIISMVSTSQRLQSPMYFFLGHLALLDLIIVTSVVPKMLDVIINEGSVVPFVECLAQFSFYGGTVCAECFLLTAMSYDRYLAICKPLHYISLMSIKLRYSLVILSWAISFILAIISLFLVYKLNFCGPNIINYFFCDFAPLLELACSDTAVIDFEMIVLGFPIFISPFLFILITYVQILNTILRISSISGRQKTFSTCSSHLMVVSTFYGSMITIYMVPNRGHSLTVNKFLSLIYIVLTPLLNPLIYSLRNKEIQSSMIDLIDCGKKIIICHIFGSKNREKNREKREVIK